ncbi:MAG TPA: FtsH protease activity modulator HflK [Stellaceae bacterium]
MSWNQGGGGGGPWGGGKSPWGRGGGPQPPNLEEILRRSQDRVRRILPGGWGSGRGVLLVALAILTIWLASGIFTVQPDEEGIVLRFGAYNRKAFPGFNYHLPAPIETVYKPKVTRVTPTEIGYRSDQVGARGVGNREVPEEALMLTGDENIVDVNFTVFWVINDAVKFLFNIRAPEGTVKAAAESAMREVIGHTPITSALTEGREKVANDTKRLMQEILDSYGSGVEVVDLVLQKTAPPDQVNDAFSDVQSAKIDLDRLVNEAQAYSNKVIPEARGDASRVQQEAEAYQKRVVLQADGDADRFRSVYKSYKSAEDVTARRLYIETIESVLKNANKIVLDKSASASGVLPYLPLPSIGPRQNETAPSQAQRAPGQVPASGARGGRP